RRLPVRHAERAVAEPGEAEKPPDLARHEPRGRRLDGRDGIVRVAPTEHGPEIGEGAQGRPPLKAEGEEARGAHASHAAPEGPLDDRGVAGALDDAGVLEEG